MIDDDEDLDAKYNREAPILLKDFEYDECTMNKSFLIKQNDLDLASFQRDSNSISLTSAIILRWTVCLPSGGKKDITRCRLPLNEFLSALGLKLWIDMDEVVEIRDPVTLERFKEWVKNKENA